MQNMPFTAAAAAYFLLNGKGYFLTTFDSTGNCNKMFWEYDPSSDNWTFKGLFPDTGRARSTFFVYNNIGYVGETEGCPGIPDSHFWKYDPVQDQWTQVATLPAAMVAASTTVPVPNNAAYLFGGWNFDEVDLQDIWRYNISMDSWDSIGQMPTPPRDYALFWGFDSLMLGGGGDEMDTNYDIYTGNDFYLYNISSNQWSPVVFQNSFDSSAEGATFIYDKKGYYFGGLISYDQFTFSNKMWAFDASKFFPPDTTTKDTLGIQQIKNTVQFNVYPNPVAQGQTLTISTSLSGDISFSDALGQVIDERKLQIGFNHFALPDTHGILLYRATLQDGNTMNGKIVIY